jgi:DNA helicase-2/ATP-dependent DNA helicase PcrA
MVGMENGIFPGSASFNFDSEMEESRRLCYVGITRAKETLYMTSAETRRVFGRIVAYAQSDFIAEVPEYLKDYIIGKSVTTGMLTRNTIMSKSRSAASNNPHSLRSSYGMNPSHRDSMADATRKLDKILDGNKESSQLTVNEATMGRKIKHNKFGVGTIVKATPIGDDMKLIIAFDNQGIKNLMLSFAPLELL